MAKEYTEVGSIRMGEYGLYIKFHKCSAKVDGSWKESSIGMEKLAKALSGNPNGLNLSIEKPEDEVKRLVDGGFIDEAEAEKRIAKIPHWKKYTIKLVQEK